MGYSRSKLDNCLCSPLWITNFLHLNLKACPKKYSDHNPILLQLQTHVDWGPKPFNCLDIWNKDQSFKLLVQWEWRMMGGISLDLKLKGLKQPIKVWNKTVFGIIGQKIQDLENEIHKLDTIADARPLNVDDWARMRALSLNLKSWKIKKGQLVRQYARCRNIREKASNSKYFHAIASCRKRKKVIIS